MKQKVCLLLFPKIPHLKEKTKFRKPKCTACISLASTEYNMRENIKNRHYRQTDRPTLALTSAPMTPREVRRRYSKGRVLLTVCRKGYRYRGM